MQTSSFVSAPKKKSASIKRNGRTEPEDAGWQAIAGEEFVYEMTDRFLLTPGCKGSPDFSDEGVKTGVPKIPDDHHAFIRGGAQIDEELGAKLAKWAMGEAPKSAPINDEKRMKMIADFEAFAQSEGLAAFQEKCNTLSTDDKKLMGKQEYDRLCEVARKFDQRKESQ